MARSVDTMLGDALTSMNYYLIHGRYKVFRYLNYRVSFSSRSIIIILIYFIIFLISSHVSYQNEPNFNGFNISIFISLIIKNTRSSSTFNL